MKKKVFRTLVCLLTVAALTACGKVQSAADMNKGVEERETKEDQGAYPFTLENYGREVKVSQKPQKVLTLGPNCTELFVALGLRDYIVGTSLANHSRGPLPEYEEAYRDMPELNYGSATREAVITSGADFIYGLDWEFGDSALDIEELESYGMTVYMNAAVTLEEQYQEILDIGRIFGIEETAEAYVEEQKTRIQAAKERAKGKEPVRVLVYDSGNNGVFTCSGINFESLLIELAGGKNMFDDLEEKQWVTVSYEEVLARDPDLILIHDYDSPSVEEKIAEIKANDTLSQLDCVKEERFAVIPLESVLAGDRMADTVERLSEAFYPETAE
ncbi:ABC transporter substrate-binding protein [Roseburia hominis]